VTGHVYASVFAPSGATQPISSLRVASSGAMNIPAGITMTAITGTEGAAAIGSRLSGSAAVTARWTRFSGGRLCSAP
jgi:hypothetical protein